MSFGVKSFELESGVSFEWDQSQRSSRYTVKPFFGGWFSSQRQKAKEKPVLLEEHAAAEMNNDTQESVCLILKQSKAEGSLQLPLMLHVLSDRLIQITQLLSIIWKSNCCDVSDTCSFPHGYTGKTQQPFALNTNFLRCVVCLLL